MVVPAVSLTAREAMERPQRTKALGRGCGVDVGGQLDACPPTERRRLRMFIRNVGDRLSFVSCNRAHASSASQARRIVLFFFVPLINQALHYHSHLKEFFLLFTISLRVLTRNRVFPLEEDGLLGAHLFAQAAVDAADHVDLELFGASTCAQGSERGISSGTIVVARGGQMNSQS